MENRPPKNSRDIRLIRDYRVKARDNEGKTALGILRLKMQMEFRCMEYSWKEVIAMLEEEYSKLDSSEPAVKRLKKD